MTLNNSRKSVQPSQIAVTLYRNHATWVSPSHHLPLKNNNLFSPPTSKRIYHKKNQVLSELEDPTMKTVERRNPRKCSKITCYCGIWCIPSCAIFGVILLGVIIGIVLFFELPHSTTLSTSTTIGTTATITTATTTTVTTETTTTSSSSSTTNSSSSTFQSTTSSTDTTSTATSTTTSATTVSTATTTETTTTTSETTSTTSDTTTSSQTSSTTTKSTSTTSTTATTITTTTATSSSASPTTTTTHTSTSSSTSTSTTSTTTKTTSSSTSTSTTTKTTSSSTSTSTTALPSTTTPSSTSTSTTTTTTTSDSCNTAPSSFFFSRTTGVIGWTQVFYNYTAPSTQPLLVFAFSAGGSGYNYLDDVSVVDVIAPTVELLDNPSFDNSTANLTSSWGAWCATATVCNSGTPGQLLANSSCHTGNCYVDHCHQPNFDYLLQDFSATIGHIYTISFWYQQVGSGPPKMYAYVQN